MPLISNNGQGNLTETIMASNLLRGDVWLYKKIFETADESDLISDLEALNMVSDMELDDSMAKWAERGYIFKNARVQSVVSTGSLGGARITLTANSHSRNGTSSPFRVASTVKIGNFVCRIEAKNTSVANAHTIDVYPMSVTNFNPSTDPYVSIYQNMIGRPTSAAINLATAITGGETIIVIGSAYGQGSSNLGEGEITVPLVYNTYTQIFRDTMTIDRSTKTNRMPLDLTTSDGKNVYADQIEVDTVKRHKALMAVSAMVQQGGAFNTPSGQIKTMDSLEGYTDVFGGKLNNGGVWSLQTIDTLAAMLVKTNAPKKQCIRAGFNAALSISNVFLNITQNGGVVYDQKLIDLNFQAFKRSGWEFYVKEDKSFQHPEILGSVGQPYADMAILHGVNKEKDPKNGSSGYSFDIIFKKDSKYLVGNDGIFSPTKTGDYDGKKMNITSEIACRALGARQFIKVTP